MKYTLIFILFLLFSCQKTDQSLPYSVPVIFETYLNRFSDEATKRGQAFDLKKEGITIKLAKLSNNYYGTTNYETRTIEMDSSWLTANDFLKQARLFHELGHLILKRDHNLFHLPNGEASSLMWTNENNSDKCTTPIYKGSMRQKYYLDELFNPNTPAPDWSTQTSTNTPTAIAANQLLFRQDELNGSLLSSLWQKILNSNTATVTPLLSNGSLKLQIFAANFRGFQLSVADLFPNLDTTTLKDYELRIRLKENNSGFQFDWRPNVLRDNAYFFSSGACETNTFFVFDYWGGRYTSNGISPNGTDWNEYIFRNKDGKVSVWLNQKMVFTSEIQTTTQPFSWIAYFSLYPGLYEFDYFRLYKL